MSSQARHPELAENWARAVQSANLAGGPEWLQSIRAAAASEYLRSGLPGNKDEAWKYTSLRPLEELGPSLEPLESGTATPLPQPLLLAGEDGFGLSVVDGHPGWKAGAAPEGVTLLRLEEALVESESGLVEPLRRLLETIPGNGRSHAFEALNTALFQNGVVLHVAAGVDAGTCCLQWVQGRAGEPRFINFRMVVLLEPGARIELLEEFRPGAQENGSSGRGQALNLVTQVSLGEQAGLSHLRLHSGLESQILFTFTGIEQAASSRYDYCGIGLGGKLVRHDIQCRMAGPGAQARLNGAFILSGEQHLDHHLCVDHLAPSCSSEQFFRGVLTGRSRGVFNGKALIRPGADGSKVRQSNANLLLSDLAEMDTKPELEIYADEVEASHGATVGQLDEQAVFYLRCRGLSEQAARRMLTSAFCKAVTDRLADRPLAQRIETLLDAALQDTGETAGALK